MAKRLMFVEFREAVATRSIPADLLLDYVMLDPESAVPVLMFKPDALLDSPPRDYDVDAEVWKFTRDVSRERQNVLKSFSFVPQKRVVLEGDSWFLMPGDGSDRWPKEIGDWLNEDLSLDCTNIAYWGDTLEVILYEKAYLDAIRGNNPHYLLISAGGNDIRRGVENHKFIHKYDPSLPPENYLTPAGEDALLKIGKQYAELIKDVADLKASVRVVCHGYDYARPTANSKFIGRFLAQLGIPEKLMAPITTSIINKLNVQIAAAVKGTTAIYVNCRGLTDGLTWHDDMHPNADGFKAVAAQLRNAIT